MVGKANFRFKKNNTQFVEDLVFFLKDNQVQAVNFGLEHSAIEDIKSQAEIKTRNKEERESRPDGKRHTIGWRTPHNRMANAT